MVSMTTEGGSMSPSSTQGDFLVSKDGASTSQCRIGLPPFRDSTERAASNKPQVVSSTSAFHGFINPPRQRFHIVLKEGETNVVSWKQLIEDEKKTVLTAISESYAGANPALETHITPKSAGLTNPIEELLPAPENRLGSVIEKVDRLFQGMDSKEEHGIASGDESWYNLDDSFIDDTELDEYFSVGTSKTRQTGFFINKGKLETVPKSPPRHLLPPSSLVYEPQMKKSNIAKRKSSPAELLNDVVAGGELAKKRLNTGVHLKGTPGENPDPISPPLKGIQSSLGALVRYTDREMLLMEGAPSIPLSPTLLPPVNEKTPQKRNPTIKSRRWHVDDTVKETKQRGRHADLGKSTSMDKGRSLPVEIVPTLISLKEARSLTMIFDLGTPGLSHAH